MNIYMFPMSDESKTISKNPFIENLVDAMEKNNCVVINKGKITKYGIFDLLLYVRKVDIYYLNWVENLSDRRFGVIQSVLFLMILMILKLFRKKIVWMLHNKISHSKNKLLIKVITTYFLVNYADKIITMSQDGIRFANIFMKKNRVIDFRDLPVEDNMNKLYNIEKDIDILIWGKIDKYKAVDSFLELLEKKQLSKKYKILIIGTIVDARLAEKLYQFKSKNITIEDKFISRNKLEDLHAQAKIILFTYAGYSTLSSAALMDSLSYGSKIVGPHVGAFRDLKEEGLIETFLDYNNLVDKLDNILSSSIVKDENIEKFIKYNSWGSFGKWVCEKIHPKHI